MNVTISLIDLLRVAGWIMGGLCALVVILFAVAWKLTRSDVVNGLRSELREELGKLTETLAKCVTAEKLDRTSEQLNQRITEVSREVSRVEREGADALQETLVRIESKIDEKESKDSKSRHDLRDKLAELQLKVELAIRSSNGRRPREGST